MENLVGKRVKLIKMEDPYAIESGSLGTITSVGYGVLSVDWDNGRKLGIVDEVDEYEILN